MKKSAPLTPNSNDNNDFIGEEDVNVCCVHSHRSSALSIPKTIMSFRQNYTLLFPNNIAHHEFHVESKTFKNSSIKGYSTLTLVILAIKGMLMASTYANNIQITTEVVKDYETLQNHSRKFTGFKAISVITYDMDIIDRTNTMTDIIKFRNRIINSSSLVDNSSFEDPSEIPKIILKSTTFSLDEEYKQMHSLSVTKKTIKMLKEQIGVTIESTYPRHNHAKKQYNILTMNPSSNVYNQNTQRLPSYYERSYDYSSKAVRSDEEETLQQKVGISINTQGKSRVTVTINARVEVF